MLVGQSSALYMSEPIQFDASVVNTKCQPSEELDWFYTQRLLIEAEYSRRLHQLALECRTRPSLGSSNVLHATEESAALRSHIVQRIKENTKLPLDGPNKLAHSMGERTGDHEGNVVQAVSDLNITPVTESVHTIDLAINEMVDARQKLVAAENKIQQSNGSQRDANGIPDEIFMEMSARRDHLGRAGLNAFVRTMAELSTQELATYRKACHVLEKSPSVSLQANGGAVQSIPSPAKSPQPSSVSLASQASQPRARSQTPSTISAASKRRSNDSLKDAVGKYKPVPNPAFKVGKGPAQEASLPAPTTPLTSAFSTTSTSVSPPVVAPRAASPTYSPVVNTPTFTSTAQPVAATPMVLTAPVAYGTTPAKPLLPTSAPVPSLEPIHQPLPKDEKWTISTRRTPNQRSVQPLATGGDQAKQVLETVRAELQSTATPTGVRLVTQPAATTQPLPRLPSLESFASLQIDTASIISNGSTAVHKTQPPSASPTPSMPRHNRLSLESLGKKLGIQKQTKDERKLSDGTPVKRYVQALWNYTAQISCEISFNVNDKLGVIREQNDGWWEAEIVSDPKRRVRGLVPGNYMVAI